MNNCQLLNLKFRMQKSEVAASSGAHCDRLDAEVGRKVARKKGSSLRALTHFRPRIEDVGKRKDYYYTYQDPYLAA